MDKQLSLEHDPLPEEFASLTEAGEFWDIHSTVDYEDVMEDVAFEVNWGGKSAHYFVLRLVDRPGTITTIE